MDDKERDRILESVSEIGDSLVRKGTRPTPPPDQNLGLCSTCKNLCSYKTKLMDEAYWCGRFSKRLSPVDPVEKCTKYWKVGWQHVCDIKEMAIIIQPKNKVGFGGAE